MKALHSLERVLFVLLCAAVMLSCTFASPAAPAPAPTADTGLESTRIALGIQQTMVSIQQTELAAEPVALVEPPATAAPQVVTATAEPTEIPVEPTWTDIPEATDTPEPEATVQSMEDRIRSANILIYEDIRGYYDLTTWVNKAVNGMDFSGGKIVEVGDAVGDFMTNLNSPTRWDLIIVAAEIRKGVRGEFWDVIGEQVNDNVGLIAEIWYLDEIASGRISTLMGQCGISYQKDWWRDPDSYNELNYSLYWLDQNNELFSEPNIVGPLYTPNIYWTEDVGDILHLSSGGDATLLAGLYPNEKSRYGVLASCMDGRVLFQTFSSHDYRQSQVIPLWQNYITYTLKNHFEAIDAGE